MPTGHSQSHTGTESAILNLGPKAKTSSALRPKTEREWRNRPALHAVELIGFPAESPSFLIALPTRSTAGIGVKEVIC
jgi:hypothetical protein